MKRLDWAELALPGLGGHAKWMHEHHVLIYQSLKSLYIYLRITDRDLPCLYVRGRREFMKDRRSGKSSAQNRRMDATSPEVPNIPYPLALDT